MILFNIQRETCSSGGIYLDALSPESVPLFIMANGVSQIYIPKPFVHGPHFVDRDPHQFPFEDLTNPPCSFSGNDHPGRCMLILPEVLTARDLSNC
jgi:hypothetical protein